MKSNLPLCLCCCSLVMCGCGSRRANHSVEQPKVEVVGPKSVIPRQVSSNGHPVPDEVLESARELVPGFAIEEVEREREDGRISWSLEGEARGRHIELEIEEAEIVSR